MASGYVWVATDWLAAAVDSSSTSRQPHPRTMCLIHGVVTLRQYTPDSAAKRSLTSRSGIAVAGQQKNQRASAAGMNAYGLASYDAVWMAACAIDEFLVDGWNVTFSADPRLHDANASTLRLGSLKVFDQGEQLLQKVMLANFTCVTGHVRFGAGRSLAGAAYGVLNVGGTGVRRVGYWSNSSRLSVAAPTASQINGSQQQQRLYSMI